MTFFKSFVFRALSDGTVYGLTLVNHIIITRAIGRSGRGRYSILATLVVILSLLLAEGFRRSNAYFAGNDGRKAPQLLSNLLVYGGLVLALMAALSALRIPLPGLNFESSLVALALLIPAVSILYQGTLSIFLGLERMTEYNLIPVAFVCLYVGLNFISLRILNYGLGIIMLNWFSATLFSSMVAFYLLWSRVGLGRLFDPDLFRSTLSIGFKGMAISVLIALMFRADIFLVNHYLREAATGVYSIAILFAEMLQKVPNVAGTVLFPKVTSSRFTASGDALTAKVTRCVFLSTLICSVFLLIFGRRIIVFAFNSRGEDFSGAYLPLVLMIPGILALASGSIVNSNLWAKGFPGVAVVAPAVSLLAKLALGWILIPRYGLAGASVASSAAYILWCGIIFGYFVSSSGSVGLRDLLVPKVGDVRASWR